MKSLKFVPLFLALIFMLSSCVDEKDLVNSWSTETNFAGEKGKMFFVFEKNKSFKQYFIPEECNKIGFEVKGSWKLSLTGELKLEYKPSTLKSIMAVTDVEAENKFLRKVRDRLRETEEGKGLKVSFNKSKTEMTLDFDDYEQVDDSDIEDLISEFEKCGSRSKSVFGSGMLPTSGSIHQFDYLSERYVTSDEVMSLSLAERRILRNAIYAMHDYDFDSADLRRYFSNFDEFYPSTKYPSLNKIEEYNINFIKRYE